jgi:hypothetical protein
MSLAYQRSMNLRGRTVAGLVGHTGPSSGGAANAGASTVDGVALGGDVFLPRDFLV